jgi:hypothetical protein
LVDGVVGRAAVRAVGEQVGLGELLGVRSAGDDEEPGEGASVVLGGLWIAVPPGERFDQVGGAG